MENNFKFYNTLTKKIETVIPHEDGKIAMYTCGPTVYHFAHIGNLRSYIMEDVLEKSLRYVGYDVKRVMNITDVGHLASDADTGEFKEKIEEGGFILAHWDGTTETEEKIKEETKATIRCIPPMGFPIK